MYKPSNPAPLYLPSGWTAYLPVRNRPRSGSAPWTLLPLVSNLCVLPRAPPIKSPSGRTIFPDPPQKNSARLAVDPPDGLGEFHAATKFP